MKNKTWKKKKCMTANSVIWIEEKTKPFSFSFFNNSAPRVTHDTWSANKVWCLSKLITLREMVETCPFLLVWLLQCKFQELHYRVLGIL
jgi:hypothetical protein